MNFVRKYQPYLIALLAFVVFAAGINAYIQFDQRIKKKNERGRVFQNLISKKSKLEQALSSRIYYTKGVAAYVSLNPETNTAEYIDLVKELIGQDSVIHTMSLAKDGIITAMYPKKGNEAALGLNLLEHPKRKKIVKQTIETRKTFVAGPVELMEGGIAFISYTPIFDKTSPKKNNFWGITDIVIKRYELFQEAELATVENGYAYALRGVNGKGSGGAVFWGREEIFENNPVTIDINLPTGKWILASSPVGGWSEEINDTTRISAILFTGALIISLLIGLLARTYIKLKETKDELKAIFEAMNSVVIEFDQKGVYRYIAPSNKDLLVQPAKKLLGKNLYDIFPSKKAEFFHDAIKKCFESKETVEIDYPMEINGKEIFFKARISYMNKDRVIYLAYDNTKSKQAEQELKTSREKLKELNNMKDKFFSIIAHDLKNPIGSFMHLTDMLYANYDELENGEKKEIAEELKDASKDVYKLLDNLLQWSRSQRGKIPYDPEFNDLHYISENVISSLKIQAKQKQIDIINNIPEKSTAFFDANMVITIFRNLISNAIKFTYPKGKIELDSKETAINNKKFRIISVSDDGMGIPDDKKKSLFNIGEAFTTHGTNDEKGTGLGLIIIKEFIQKHEGEIWVESEEFKGTTFYFTLPVNPNQKK